MKRNAIPSVPPGESVRRRFDAALKERMDMFSGDIGEKIVALDTATATTADCAAKINEILMLLQKT
jgi:hypothetical protein